MQGSTCVLPMDSWPRPNDRALSLICRHWNDFPVQSAILFAKATGSRDRVPESGLRTDQHRTIAEPRLEVRLFHSRQILSRPCAPNSDICPPAARLRGRANQKPADIRGGTGLTVATVAGWMDTQSCPHCNSPEVAAALTIDRLAYLRCSECTHVWSIRERRDSPASTAPRYRAKDRRIAQESPVIHDNLRIST